MFKSNQKIDTAFDFKQSEAKIIVDLWCKENKKTLVRYLDGGASGYAFLLEDEVVIKVTSSMGEAVYAYEAMQESPEGYVPIYSVEMIKPERFIVTMKFLDIEPKTKSLAERLFYSLDTNGYAITSDIEDIEHLIQTETEYDIYCDLHAAVMNCPQFPMVDVHEDNIGFCNDTFSFLVFDQFFVSFSKAEYLQRIEQSTIQDIFLQLEKQTA